MKILLNTTVGNRDLCAWQPVKGVVWIQTREPNHTERLVKRSDSRLVAYGVAGGYLRTFEFRRSMSWAIQLIKRYTSGESPSNEASDDAIGSRTNRVPDGAQ
jgi:hypothetical protein